MPQIQPKIAIGDQLLTALLALPSTAMKKAKETIKKFQSNPTSPGLNYETINGSKDKRLHSVRIDQDYRGIILKQYDGGAYIFLWIDKHDDAYNWAARHKFGVNKHTGSIQIVATEESVEVEAPKTKPVAKVEDTRPDIFLAFSDKDLHQIGATEELIPIIRTIKEIDDVEKLERRFPSQVYDALYMLALGEPYNEVLDELGIKPEEQFDTEDFNAALDLATNQQHFLSITDDSELEAILNEPLAKWRVFLHPSQRKLVQANFNGPARVLGGAGTGKTVVAMHRAKHLASACSDSEKVFFTTFTKSLITDIKSNLQKFCSFDEIRSIDIENLDKWCHRYLRDNGFDRTVCFDGDKRLVELWDRAMESLDTGEHTTEFLHEEWKKVIQYNDINELENYIRVPRLGRKGRLSRMQRKQIWPVFNEYKTLLKESQIWEQADMYRAARLLLEQESTTRPFKHVIVDEIQDFHPEAFRLLKAMTPRDDENLQNGLFLVGDGHQNIYGHHIVLSKLGINIRGRGKRLRLNYRTPEKTRKWATRILLGQEVSDLDGGNDDGKGYRSILNGPEPTISICNSFDAEIEEIAQWIQELKQQDQSKVICVCLHTNPQREKYAAALVSKGLAVHEITSTQSDIEDLAPIRLITAYRIKGLEFDDVCLAGSSASNWKHNNLESKCLIHVAATRTKNSLKITAPGSISPLFGTSPA